MSATHMSWGRYPHIPQTIHPCYWQKNISGDLSQLHAEYGQVLPYGNGRSYGDSCLSVSDHVLYMQPLDRFIHADWDTGIIRAEAGVTLQALLALAIPQGWFLPVTPGTQYVTLGGAVANDVHGKNHHVRGTFGCHILRFALVRSDHEAPIICSRQEHVDLFAATIGGLGLTGIIAWVEIQLMPIRSSLIDVQQIRFNNLREFFALSAEWDEKREYTVAWIDCLARGANAGRGIFFCGDHASEGDLKVEDRKGLSMKFTPPLSLVNRLSLRAFNELYYRRGNNAEKQVSYKSFFYPLDKIGEWNRMYGPRGFQQYQCVIPDGNAQDAMLALLHAIAQSGKGSFLAVLKRCGTIASPGLLSFPLPGVSLALDFPQDQSLTAKLFPLLDTIVRNAGGRLYPAKDAHMSGEDFRNSYPRWQPLETLRDPVLCSRFWQRVMA